MSEFLAESRILIRPDTTKFRAELLTAVATAAKGVVVPITVAPVVTGGGLAAVAAQAGTATTAVNQLTAAQQLAGAQATKTAAQVRAQAQNLGQLEKAAIASGAGFLGLRGAVLTAGTAFLAVTVAIQGFARAVQNAAQLESDLNVFRVTAGATAEEMERVRDQAKALGRDLELPGVTAQDAAQTFLTLSRAGLSVQDSLAGARGTLQLATAAEISFADASQLTASALNAFALSGDSAVEVADTLTNAANASQASISDMGIALQQSAAIADLVGFSLSETVTFLTQLAQAGLRGSDAGTSFRVAIQRLIAPTDKAREVLGRLNLNLRDAQGNLRPEVFFELGEALERMSRAQADATRQVIFGNDASRAAAFFARLNAEAFREQERELNRQGAAAEVASARNEGFAGSVENATNQVTAFGTELGELSLPALGEALDLAAAQFGLYADAIALASDQLEQAGDQAEEFGRTLRIVSDETGFTDFVRDVTDGARLVEQDIERAEGGLRGFLVSLEILEPSTSAAATQIKILSDEEARLAEAIHDAVRPTVEQTTSLDELAAAARSAAQAVAALQGQERGLEEQVARARIADDQGAELDALRAQREALERELAAQEAIIARPGTSGEATARQAIRNRILPQLETVNNEIDNIIQQQASERQQQADNAARAFLDALAGRREDADRQAGAAAETAGLADDIRAQDRIQALIKIQIEKIRARVRDEDTRRAAIRDLRQALIDSRREEDALRAQQQADRQARIDTIQELNIAIAQETGNEAAEKRAIEARIKRLNDQIDAAKGDQVKTKQLILERERLRNQLEELTQQEKKNNKAAQEFFFEQLQAQQGFAANLLGNIITGPTEGLVGVPSPAAPAIPDLGARIGAEVGAATGRAQLGPTAGQTNTEISILERILLELKRLNGSYDAPEAINQKKSGSGSMDIAVM